MKFNGIILAVLVPISFAFPDKKINFEKEKDFEVSAMKIMMKIVLLSILVDAEKRCFH